MSYLMTRRVIYAGAVVSMQFPSPWEDWSQYISLTYPDGSVSGSPSEAQLVLDLSPLDAEFWDSVDPTGKDIRVARNDNPGVSLNYILVDWDYMATTGYLIVFTGGVTDAADTTFRLYTGNSSATAPDPASVGGFEDQCDTEGIQALYPFAQDPSGSAPQLSDHSGHGNNGTTAGGMTPADLISGPAGLTAWDFDADDEVNFTWTGITGTVARTFKFWFKMPSRIGTNKLYQIMKLGTETTGPGFEGARFDVGIDRVSSGHNDGGLFIAVNSGFENYSLGLDDNTWHHVVIKMPNTPDLGDVDVIIDGVAQANTGSRVLDTDVLIFALAKGSTISSAYQNMNGSLALFSALDVNISDDLGITEYTNQNSNQWVQGATVTP